MMRHDQFQQSLASLTSMYSSCAHVRQSSEGKHPHWKAVLMQGPLEQLRELQAEMHGYLKLPHPLPDLPLPGDSDPVSSPVNVDEFHLAVENLRRLYTAAGSLRVELGQYRPRLYATLVRQLVPSLSAIQQSLAVYLKWDEVEKTLAELEVRQNGADGTDSSGPSLGPVEQQERTAGHP